MVEITPEDQKVFDRLKSTGRVSHALRRLITQRFNYCSECDHLVFHGRPAFAGYDERGRPVFAGACCAERLVELATPVYWQGSLNLSIDEKASIWRYMDFAKFVAMISQGGLYFPRADSLEDPFEGALGLARREADWDAFYLRHMEEAVRTAPDPDGQVRGVTDEYASENAARLLRELKAGSARARKSFVSCWHQNSGESEALWRLYCPPSTVGVAVKATVGSLWDATANFDAAVVGRVHYLDFRRSFAVHDGRERLFCKRLSLSHEREVRAVIPNEWVEDERPGPGVLVACPLQDILREVVISPFAPGWFQATLQSVMDRFDVALPVRASELLEQPFY